MYWKSMITDIRHDGSQVIPFSVAIVTLQLSVRHVISRHSPVTFRHLQVVHFSVSTQQVGWSGQRCGWVIWKTQSLFLVRKLIQNSSFFNHFSPYLFMTNILLSYLTDNSSEGAFRHYKRQTQFFIQEYEVEKTIKPQSLHSHGQSSCKRT